MAVLTLVAWQRPPVEAAENEAVRAEVEEGIELYGKGQYDQAIHKLSKAASLAPEHSPAPLYLGLAYLRLADNEKAVAQWQRYAELELATRPEKEAKLDERMPRYLTLILRKENERLAQRAVAHERTIGPGDPKTVAVTYYQNLGSPALTPLQKGLAALLIDDLSKVRELRVVERERMQALLDEARLSTSGLVDAKTAPRVGRLLGAGKVTTGSFLDREGKSMQISSVVAESTTAAIVSDQNTNGSVDQFFELEKRLALAHLKDLGYDERRPGSQEVIAEVRKPQTRSMPAMIAYSNGLDAKDRQNYPEARRQFEAAVREDPNFELPRRELLLLPLLALSVDKIIAAVESAAPSAKTAGLALEGGSAATLGVNTTTAALVAGGVAVAGGAIAGGLAASGGGGGGGGGGAVCGNGRVDSGEACDPPLTQAQCLSGDFCTNGCNKCVRGSSCEGRCCSGRSDTCAPPGSTCFCDETCGQFGDCCGDFAIFCGGSASLRRSAD